MPDIFMPRLSDTMEEGTITRWLKQQGEQVNKGDIVAEVETDKANMEIAAYEAGILEQILVKEGETAPIGQTIALLGDGKTASKQATSSAPAQTTPAARAPQEPAAPPASNNGTSTPAPVMASTSTNGTRVKVSPLARRIAEEHGIDLTRIQGTGPGGRIVRDDLEEFMEVQRTQPAPATALAEAPAPVTPAPQPQTAVASNVQPAVASADEVVNLTQMQKVIARRLNESKQTIPHFYVRNEVDMTEALALRQRLNASVGEGGVKVSVNDLIVKACALALERSPEVNSSYKDAQFIRHKRVNIGIAVDIPNGLVVPVIHDANLKGVRTIAREAKTLIEKARNGKLTATDLEGGTFSISNLGMMDVTDFSAIINPPEAAILAVASARKSYVPIDNQPVLRDLMPLTISADHRILYGATVARFLQEVKRLLQDPYSLLG